MSVITRFTGVTILIVMMLQLNSCKQKATTPEDMFLGVQQLQQEEKYEDAIKLYRKIADTHHDSRQGANSQFMIAYIYSNHLQDTSNARIEFNRFLDEFSAAADSGLIEGAKFELKYMGMSIDEIPGNSSWGPSRPRKSIPWYLPRSGGSSV